MAKALYRNTMTDLFGRLESPRKRVMSARHVQILSLLLDEGRAVTLSDLTPRLRPFYAVKNPHKAMIRDLNYLIGLQAVRVDRPAGDADPLLSANLDWPTQITETEFFRRVKELPKGKRFPFLSS